MARVEIDADIRKAVTPPSELYTDAGIFDDLREKVFARSWQWLDVPRLEAGSAVPCALLPELVNAPLVVSRDGDGSDHCFSNVCTHRGHLVCKEMVSGTRGLRCGYHGRRFRLDGSFEHMPAFEEVDNFPTKDDDLTARPLHRWGPLAFTSLEDTAPFDEWIDFTRDRVAFLPFDDFQPDPEGTRSYEVEANWILYCENFLEGFHIPFVHASLNEVLEFGEYKVELFPSGTLQVGIAKEGEPVFELPGNHVNAGQRVGAFYAWLFPNLMLNFYPWGLSLNAVLPLAPTKTRVEYRRYLWRPDLLDQGAGGDLHRVEMEDEAVVESVQKGVGSRLYRRGRYSPKHERGTHHLHRLLSSALG